MSNAGKGSRYRPIDRKKWDKSWRRVFAGEDLPEDLEKELIERRRELLKRIDNEDQND